MQKELLSVDVGLNLLSTRPNCEDLNEISTIKMCDLDLSQALERYVYDGHMTTSRSLLNICHYFIVSHIRPLLKK